MIKDKNCLKKELCTRIERIEKELTELKQIALELASQPETPKQNTRSNISKEYIAARDWARKTLNLRL